ncbi:hypothetical protein NR800_21430 [Corallococcus interemptor]|uniref:hypothetical protein n=1 Tax=Corallococcus TaxID=83461 RepID=UPI001CBFEC56|nr:hypothetical protein [Corallococcus sp. AS-1-12]MBZ4330368.1 hypothetical protein [Corallococcus sp. AS-1-12]
MKMLRWSAAALALFVVGCGSVEEAALETQEAELRSCSSILDCVSGCTCGSGLCVPGPGPTPPAGYCDQAPVRACTTSSQCAAGCACTGSVCVASPSNPSANCLVAPPDGYESDNTHTSASSYLGTPQLNHTFHNRLDIDWVLVATPVNQVLTVEAYNLRDNVQAQLDLYAYDYATRTRGALLATTQSKVCADFTPTCQRYRVTANVVAGGVYAVRLVNRADTPAGSDWRPTPTYDLKMY